MQYTEEHYAQMYNDLPEGLKDLVLSGRLAILVSAIGSRHGLNADQVADLEPSIEDVCLGLITKDELVDNILKNVNVDQRVANRIAAEAELEILKPFEAELIIARKQKEDLDQKIKKESGGKKVSISSDNFVKAPPKPVEPKDVSEHAQEKKVADWYNKTDVNESSNDTKGAVVDTSKNNFDWDKDFGKKAELPQNTPSPSLKKEGDSAIVQSTTPTLENKLDVLTESINKLVNTRFGPADKKEEGVSTEMQELLKRLEKAEKENEENKKLINSLQNNKETKPLESIFGTKAASADIPTEDNQTKIQIDKERKVDIDHKDKTEKATAPATINGNIQITSISKAIEIQKKNDAQEIFTSSVSKDTLDSIVETRNKVTPTISSAQPATSTKKVLSIDELISKGDSKMKVAVNKPATLVFPGLNEEKRVDIKNLDQKENLRQTLLDDLEFLKNDSAKKTENKDQTTDNSPTPDLEILNGEPTENDPAGNPQVAADTNAQATPTNTYSTNPFKDELLPKTKEERMKVLQDKIKALNKGVSSGGKTNISASGLDPYRL